MTRKKFTGSGFIVSAGWEKGILEVEFTSGGIYRYKGVSERIWKEFLASRHKHTYFAKHIIHRYKVEGVKNNAPSTAQEGRTKADAYKD